MTARKLYSQSAKVVIKQISLYFSIFFLYKRKAKCVIVGKWFYCNIRLCNSQRRGDHLQTEGRVYVARAIHKAILARR